MPRFVADAILPADLLNQARALGLDTSQACDGDLYAEISKCLEAQWLKDNKDALASSNDYVDGPVRRLC